MPTIRIDDDVFNGLKSLAEAFVDTPNTVIRRLLAAHLGALPAAAPRPASTSASASSSTSANLQAHLLRVLARNFGGTGSKRAVEIAAIKELADQGLLNEADYERVSNGETKIQRSLGWAKHALKEAGLVTAENRRGVWGLTPEGLAMGLGEPSSAPLAR